MYKYALEKWIKLKENLIILYCEEFSHCFPVFFNRVFFLKLIFCWKYGEYMRTIELF